MRPRKCTLRPRDIEECGVRILQENVKLKDAGRKCSANVLLAIVLYAAARVTSICDACRRLKNGPGDDAVRRALANGLPGVTELTRRLNQALLDCLPARVLRRLRGRLRLAIDLTLIPYHGRPFRRRCEIYRGEAKSGTTHFHAYATCYMVHHGRRFTLAMVYVLRGTPLVDVIDQLLQAAKNAGIQPKVLLLDRGFFQAKVVNYLNHHRIAYLMPMVMRGRRPSHPKGPSGTYIFAAWKRSGQSTYSWKSAQGAPATVSVCVVRTRRTKRSRPTTLVYAYGGFTPSSVTWVRETYRLRFGIESTYRQMNQARIYTCTRNPVLRLFFVGVALVVRNLWVWLHYMMLSEPRAGCREIRLEKLRFKTMLLWLAHFIESQLGVDDTIEAHLPTRE
jgi:putative transposase